MNLLFRDNKYVILEMEFGENDIISTFQYNDTADILIPNHSIKTRIKAPGMQHREKNKKARFFEQFCK